MIDILIPSLRPDKLAIIVSQIEMFSDGADYKLYTDMTPGGIYKAVERMVSVSSNKYVLHIPDDINLMPGFLINMLKFMQEHDDELIVADFHVTNGVTEYSQHYYWNQPFSAFPCIKRDDIKKVGGLMDTYYSSFYGDPDLSLRVINAGGSVKKADNAWIHYVNFHDTIRVESSRNFEEEDKKKFIARWEPKYGEFKGCTH